MKNKVSLWSNIILTTYFLVILGFIIYACISPSPEPSSEDVNPFALGVLLQFFSAHIEAILIGMLFIVFLSVGFFLHIFLIFIAQIFGWLGYIKNKRGFMITFATLNCIVSFPGVFFIPQIYIIPFICTILGFIAAKKQKKINSLTSLADL